MRAAAGERRRVWGVLRRPCLASLIVAFYLLTAPAMALAECAWVLWQRTIDRNGATAWEPVAGSSEPGCAWAWDASLAAERQVATSMEVGKDTTRWTVMKTVMKKEDENTPAVTKMYEYRCLPDTVDPRGAKGK